MTSEKFRTVSLAAISVVLTCNSTIAAPPIVDGVFGEWTKDTLVGTDVAGDASSVFDVTEISAASSGTVLYVSFKIESVRNIQAGPIGEDTLRLEVGFRGSVALTIDFRNRQAYTGGNPSNYVPWSTIGFRSMTTYASDRFEIRADLGAFGIGVGDTVTLDLSGSDTLDAPAPFTLQQPAEDLIRRDPGRHSDTTFRIASLNTLGGGLLNGVRREPIGRLVQGIAADVYCFQEQNSPEAFIAGRMAELDPLGNGLPWEVHRINDTVITSQQTMIPLIHGGDAAAIINWGSNGAVLVFSIHPPCCGYIGSVQDQARITEMEGIAETIQELRAGQLGQAFEPYQDVPVIIIGDWNLVGSRDPLDIVNDPQGPAMMQWLLPHLSGNDVHTWRDLNESPGSFAPGLLDLLAFSDALLIPRNGFVLDSRELSAAELQMMGLNSEDSDASDHLMLVGDFVLSQDCNDNGIPDLNEAINSGDFNGNGIVELDDFKALANCLAGHNLPPISAVPACVTMCEDAFDKDDDGDVDLADFGVFQVAFTGLLP